MGVDRNRTASSLTCLPEAVPQDGCAGDRRSLGSSAHGLGQSRSELGSGTRCLGQLQFMGLVGFGAESPKRGLSLPPQTRSGCVSLAQGSGGSAVVPLHPDSISAGGGDQLGKGSGSQACAWGLEGPVVFGLVCLLKNKPPGLGDLWFPLCLYVEAGGAAAFPGRLWGWGLSVPGPGGIGGSTVLQVLGSAPAHGGYPPQWLFPGTRECFRLLRTLHPLAPTPGSRAAPQGCGTRCRRLRGRGASPVLAPRPWELFWCNTHLHNRDACAVASQLSYKLF